MSSDISGLLCGYFKYIYSILLLYNCYCESWQLAWGDLHVWLLEKKKKKDLLFVMKSSNCVSGSQSCVLAASAEKLRPSSRTIPKCSQASRLQHVPGHLYKSFGFLFSRVRSFDCFWILVTKGEGWKAHAALVSPAPSLPHWWTRSLDTWTPPFPPDPRWAGSPLPDTTRTVPNWPLLNKLIQKSWGRVCVLLSPSKCHSSICLKMNESGHNGGGKCAAGSPHMVVPIPTPSV